MNRYICLVAAFAGVLGLSRLGAQTLTQAASGATGGSYSLSSEIEGSSLSVGEDATRTPDAQLAMSVAAYPVTAGDLYTLSFSVGGAPVVYSIPVDSSYQIRIANLGLINCAGLTYLQLKQQVVDLVHRNYPMAGAQFVLTTPASFMVTITGEVTSTVERNAWALTRLSTLATSQFTSYSSSRNIQVVSSGGRVRTYDLFKASRDGDLSQNPYLRPGDKVVVQRIDRRVTISGAVERPGTYDLLKGENLKSLIEYYGNGLTPTADTSRIELLRRLTGNEGAGEKFYLSKDAVEDDYELLCYDEITISSYADLMPVVFVEGAVQQTVTGEDAEDPDASTRISARFNEGEDYAFFLRRNRSWFSPVSDLEKAYIIRKGQYIPININEMLYDASVYSNIQIEPFDTLMVPFRQYFVTVSGSVRTPGRYPYIPDRNWRYYIDLAGGIVKTQNSRESVIITDIDGNALSKLDTITPETSIEVKTNSPLYYFNQIAPVVTSILSIVSTTISILAVTGVF